MFEKHADKFLIIIIIGILGILSIKNTNDQSLVLDDANTEVEGSDESEDTENIVIHITGEVNDPDVYELDNEARLIDAVEEAGGFTDKADEDGVNLALKLEDEMMVRIPSVDDEISENELGILGIVDVVESEKININTASAEELQELSGIGPKTAEKIISYREEQSFEDIEDIKNVNGIGDKMYEDIKDMIRVR